MLTPHNSLKRKSGFALVLALSLMAFVLLLVLSISTITQAEISASTQKKNHELARQNAQLALFQAIGNLQKYAGPDQRVSTTASILDSTPDTEAVDGVTDAQHWTGIWSSEYPTDNLGAPISVLDSANVELESYRNLSNRRADAESTNSRFLTWLVSGDQSFATVSSFTQDPDDTSQALLLGNTDATKRVYAPKESIYNQNNTESGRFAYWVADEGVKAKFNIRDVHKEDGTSNDERHYSFTTAQRSGIENMTTFTPPTGLNFPINETILDAMATTAELAINLSDDDLPSDSFHDLTAYSFGLLTDSKYGGLKKDLTWLFEQPSGSAFPASLNDLSFYDASAYADNSVARFADFPDLENYYGEPAPSWEKLRSFYKLKDAQSVGLQARPDNETSYGLGPIAIRGLLGVSPEVYEKVSDPTNLYLRVHLDFSVVLWNPYNVTLAAHTYEVEFMQGQAPMMLYPQFVFDEEVTENTGDAAQFKTVGSTKRYYYPNSERIEHSGAASKKGIFYVEEKGVFQHPQISSFADDQVDDWQVAGVIFKTPAIELEPGEVKVLSIETNSDPYVEGYTLTEGQYGGSVYLDYPDPLPTEVSQGITVTTGVGASATTEQRYPKFHWRPWRDIEGSSAYADLQGSNPYGTIRGFSLREPLANTGYSSRDLKVGGVPVGLDVYYSRLTNENHTRVEINGENDTNFTGRTSGPIAYDNVGTRMLNSSWNSGPNFEETIQFQAYMYPFDSGPSNLNYEKFAALVHRNPIAAEARRIPLLYQSSSLGLNYSNYTVAGWTSGPKYTPDSPATIDSNTSNQAFFGSNYSTSTGRTHLPLIDVPGKDLPIMSLGFLQHANLYRYDTAPTFQIGNSFPEIRLKELTDLVRDSPSGDSDTIYNMADTDPSIIDTTYLLNDALWDRFFFSTYEDPTEINDSDITPPNARLTRINGEDTLSSDAIDDFFELAAAHLAVNGAFNINSTSVEAWRATLGSLSDLNIDPVTGASDITKDRVVSHFAYPSGDSSENNEEDAWTGFRQLSSVQLDALAQEIVKQVKSRGPFLSMSEFVNRRLANDSTGQRGAIQSAIEALDYDSSGPIKTNDTSINGKVGAIFDTNRMTGSSSPNSLPPELFIEEASRVHHYTGIAGWVTQGDILQALAPALNARSDTFSIRAYGETLDPITGKAISEAWCEAILQRVPEPVSPKDASNTDTPAHYEVADAFGRRFEIVSFRWLSPDEI